MFTPASKVIDITAQDLANKVLSPECLALANRVFKLLHGAYGTLFLSRYATGEIDGDGADLGVKNARRVWAHYLSDVPHAAIFGAINRMPKEHLEFPPSAAQFRALCMREADEIKAKDKVEEARKALPASGKAFSDATKRSREAAFHSISQARRLDRSVQVSEGLELLISVVAEAVANGGGDEVGELRRLNQMFAHRKRSQVGVASLGGVSRS